MVPPLVWSKRVARPASRPGCCYLKKHHIFNVELRPGSTFSRMLAHAAEC
jgi:hypothetical protein